MALCRQWLCELCDSCISIKVIKRTHFEHRNQKQIRGNIPSSDHLSENKFALGPSTFCNFAEIIFTYLHWEYLGDKRVNYLFLFHIQEIIQFISTQERLIRVWWEIISVIQNLWNLSFAVNTVCHREGSCFFEKSARWCICLLVIYSALRKGFGIFSFVTKFIIIYVII